MDLLEELSRIVKFNYTLTMQEGTSYRMLVQKLEQNEIDLVVADLTLNEERANVIDFSTPFMNLGIGIIFKQESERKTDYFSFLAPFSTTIWIYILSAYAGVSLLLYSISRNLEGYLKFNLEMTFILFSCSVGRPLMNMLVLSQLFGALCLLYLDMEQRLCQGRLGLLFGQ